MRGAALVLATLAACKQPPPPAPLGSAPAARTVPIAPPSGRVDDGMFRDVELGFEVQVLDGWTADPGVMGGALRLAMDQELTGTRIEIWRFSGADLTPRPRAGCLWTFQDRGPYKDLPVPDDPVVATCMPDDPDDPRVQAWMLRRHGGVWQLEVHLPGQQMLAARRAGLAVLQTARWPIRPTVTQP